MGTKRKVKAQKTLTKNCDKCVHKSICILYHGHGQLELRFGDSYEKDPDEFVKKLDERLAYKCSFYTELNSSAPR
jgi:hypothetical protein